MLNGALVIEIVNNSFSESKKNFGRLFDEVTNVLIGEKILEICISSEKFIFNRLR